MNRTPASLLERLRRPHDPEAWDRLVELYTPLLYYWTRRLGLREPDAADLAQEVFAVLIQKLPGFHYDEHRSFRAWLRRITLNKWRDWQRRAAARHEEGQGALSEAADPDGLTALWEEEYQQHLVRRALEVMQSEFQPTTWRACWEIVVSDRPPAEVAAELGISLASAYAAKSRVLRRLRQELEGMMD
jgi:RNA polymerase sigma-70 factor (ECF subfamily)